MRLEPRIERLEAASPDTKVMVTRIELVGDPNGPRAVAEFRDGKWTEFADETLLRGRTR